MYQHRSGPYVRQHWLIVEVRTALLRPSPPNAMTSESLRNFIRDSHIHRNAVGLEGLCWMEERRRAAGRARTQALCQLHRFRETYCYKSNQMESSYQSI